MFERRRWRHTFSTSSAECRLTEALRRFSTQGRWTALLVVGLRSRPAADNHPGEARQQPWRQQLWRQLARRLTNILPPADIIDYRGQGRFQLLLSECPHPAMAIAWAEQIIQLLSAKTQVGEALCHNDVSVGIRMVPPHHTDINALLEQADEAQIFAEQHGTNNCHLYLKEDDNRFDISATRLQG